MSHFNRPGITEIMNSKYFFAFTFLTSFSYYLQYLSELYTDVLNVVLEGSLSEMFYSGLTLYFVTNRVTFCHFFQCEFLHFIK